MVREELVEGLRVALEEGETIQRAMNTFYNAGYSKEDIEAAAAALYSNLPYRPLQPQPQQIPVQKPVQKPQPQPKPQLPQRQFPQPQPVQRPQPKPVQKPEPVQRPQPKPVQKPVQKPVKRMPVSSQVSTVQRVSDYGGYSPRKARIIMTLLIILLIILVGLLITVLIFKDNLTEFFNNLFWRALF